MLKYALSVVNNMHCHNIRSSAEADWPEALLWRKWVSPDPLVNVVTYVIMFVTLLVKQFWRNSIMCLMRLIVDWTWLTIVPKFLQRSVATI